jgi:hypothetical protein
VTHLTTDPSGAVKIVLMCFSPTIDDFNNSRLSITKRGSGFPDPNGERRLISE